MRFRKGDLTVACRLGEKLRLLRGQKGWKQGDLADEVNRRLPDVGLDQTTVSRIENGNKVDYRKVLAVAAVVGVTLSWLGVSEDDQRRIAEDRALRAEVAAMTEPRHRNGVARRGQGTVKSEKEYRVYAGLSAYRKPAVAVAAGA